MNQCAGSTILEHAVIEHNLAAVSKLYQNIHVDSLARLLRIDASKAEYFAAKMITEGRLAGEIDEIDGYLYFEEGLTIILCKFPQNIPCSSGMTMSPAFASRWNVSTQRFKP